MIRLLTHLLINIARRSLWFIVTMLAGVVAGFILLLIFTIPPITSASLVNVRGPVDKYTKTSRGTLLIWLRGDQRVFQIAPGDMDFFDEATFTQEVRSGQMLSLAILKRFQTESTARPLVVFEVRSDNATYLPLQPTLNARQWGRKVLFPIIVAVALSIAVLTFVLGLIQQQNRRVWR